MSPGLKSKSKDKKSTKESQKVSTKPSAPAGSGSGIPTSAYNPTLGTFHTLERSSSTTPSGSSASIQTNGRFRNIDDSDDHHHHNATAVVEYDSVSNNGSWSGESEDPKEKATNPGSRQDTIPGAENNDKREKIRQRNEKKHQRQKEKRNQELHERCTGYLMSRKLEALAQQLVSMGFSRERSTMALILNEGRVEESVAWLFEGGEEADRVREQNLAAGSNLKIDISEELARVADLEIRYKCSKLEVERAIVSSEGDIEKATELLKALRLDPPKPDDTQIQRTQARLSNPNPNPNPNPPSPQPVVLQRRDERDFNYTKQTVTTPSNSVEPVSKILQQQPQLPKRVQPKLPPQLVSADKRWPSAAALASPLQVSSSPAAKLEQRYVTEAKNIPAGSVREPVIMMQRPQSVKQQIPSSMSVSTTATLTGSAPSWYPTSTGFMPQIPNPSTARSLSPNKLSSNQMYLHHHQIHHQNHPQNHHHHHQFHYQPSPPQQYVAGAGPMDPPGTSRANTNGMWSRAGPAPGPSQTTLAPASSLGLFSGLGSASGSAAVDWSMGGSMLQLDYSSIDWTLDRGIPPARPNGLLYNNAFSPSSSSVVAPEMMRPAPAMVTSKVNGHVSMGGGASSSEAAGGSSGSREWTSPFEGEDLFSLPRQFVSSPSL